MKAHGSLEQRLLRARVARDDERRAWQTSGASHLHGALRCGLLRLRLALRARAAQRG